MLEIVLYIAIPFALVILLRLILPSKGKIGEKRVASKLDKLPKAEYRVLNDVMLQTPKGTSQGSVSSSVSGAGLTESLDSQI